MSSLPLISHRLFVAAIATDVTCASKTPPKEPDVSAMAPKATAIPLELLHGSRPMPAADTRTLRANEATATR